MKTHAVVLTLLLGCVPCAKSLRPRTASDPNCSTPPDTPAELLGPIEPTGRGGVIEGRVMDQGGSGMIVRVSAMRAPGPAHERQTTTGSDGRFEISALLPGIYSVTGFAEGARTTLFRQVEVTADTGANLVMVMEVATCTE
jgi:hypothetical protein